MKYLFTLIIGSALLFTSCKKEAAVSCYECDLSSINESQAGYTAVGCMSKADWDSMQFYDNTGTGTLDKKAHCRVKH